VGGWKKKKDSTSWVFGVVIFPPNLILAGRQHPGLSQSFSLTTAECLFISGLKEKVHIGLVHVVHHQHHPVSSLTIQWLYPNLVQVLVPFFSKWLV
jgi:hypothetical protein